MSSEFVDDIVIKEEYKIEESHIDLCHQTLTNLPSFGERILEHPVSEIETLPPDAWQDDIPPIKSEPPDQDESGSQLHSGQENIRDIKFECSSIYDTSCETGDQTDRGKLKTNDTFCCYSCGLIFVVFESYRKHYRNHHPDMIDYDDDQVLDEQISFVPKVPNEMLCKYCLRNFDETTTYHRHMENAHLNKLYTCPYCSKSFSSKFQRNRHIDAHEGTKPHKCPHCPKAFTTRGTLKVHVVFMHMDNSSIFECRFCDKKLKRKSDLKRHELTHTAEKTLGCDECEMMFKDKRQLDLHTRKHMNMKSFECPDCDKAFPSSTYLRKHVATHRQDRPFSCEICDKTFKMKRYLHEHKRLHADEIEFACETCGKKFKRRPHLNRHIKKSH